MPNSNNSMPILSLGRTSYEANNAFDGDVLDRKELAQQLSRYINRLKEGAVLGINAPWGEGKTWFGRHLGKHLESEEHKIIHIDAFEQDYVEDPFVLIVAEILNIMDESSNATQLLKKNIFNITKALLPITAKSLINFGGKILLGANNLSGEIQALGSDLINGTAELTNDVIKEEFEKYNQNNTSMKEFKDQLTNYALEQDKPVVIFIDELDRCKPTFSVQLLERIKHFFDVPNIVFVLLLNSEQLESAIKGVYGQNTDAGAYLGKFINLSFTLPKLSATGTNGELKYKRFITQTLKKYQFEDNANTRLIISELLFWAMQFDLTLRDIEKSVGLFALLDLDDEYIYFMAYVIALKVKKPNLFQKLLKNDLTAHKEALELIGSLVINNTRIGGSNSRQSAFNVFHKMHNAYIKNSFDDIVELEPIYNNLFNIDKNTIFEYFARKIELSID